MLSDVMDIEDVPESPVNVSNARTVGFFECVGVTI